MGVARAGVLICVAIGVLGALSCSVLTIFSDTHKAIQLGTQRQVIVVIIFENHCKFSCHYLLYFQS